MFQNQANSHSKALSINNQPNLANILTAKDSEFLKQIMSLTGDHKTPQNQQNSSNLLNPLQSISQNQLLMTTNFSVQLSKQDLFSGAYDMTSNVVSGRDQPVSLERSYQKRKKERAFLTFAKLINKSLKKYSFSHTDERVHKSQAIGKWKEFTLKLSNAIKEKEVLINNWLKAYDHFQHKRLSMVFKAMRVQAPRLRIREDKELQVRVRTESKLITQTFYQWITSYNERMHARTQLYKATQFWSDRTQKRHLVKWQNFIIKKKEARLKYRNFYLVRCIFELLRKGVPRDLIKQKTLKGLQGSSVESDMKTFFKTLIEVRKLKYYQESQVDDTLYLYTMQVKALIFDQLKQHYLKCSTFKAKLMMKLSSTSLKAWR